MSQTERAYSPGLQFNGHHSRIPCNYMYRYLFTDPRGMEGRVGILCIKCKGKGGTQWDLSL